MRPPLRGTDVCQRGTKRSASSALVCAAFFAVACLLSEGCPLAIPWRVGTVVIDALKRQPGWASAHIAQECRVVVAPFIAHSDASASVSIKAAVFAVEASALGVKPRHVLSGNLATDSVAVFEIDRLVFHAAATPRPSGAELGASDDSDLSALASASPQQLKPSGIVTGFGQHRQSSERLSSQVDAFAHSSLYAVIV
jgi:hypothetical protein